MARLLIGNFKGIKGDKGEKGDDGVIDSNSIISFEDYTNSTPPPTDMALGSIKTGKSISSLLSNIKALLMSTLTTSKLANNLSTNQEGFALDARMGKQLGESVGAINERLAKNEFTITPNTNYVVEDNLKTLRRINKRCDVSLMVKYNGGNFVAGAYYHVATFDEHPTKNAYLASNVTVNGSGGGVGVSSAYIAPDGKLYLATGATILNPYFFISGHFFVA